MGNKGEQAAEQACGRQCLHWHNCLAIRSAARCGLVGVRLPPIMSEQPASLRWLNHNPGFFATVALSLLHQVICGSQGELGRAEQATSSLPVGFSEFPCFPKTKLPQDSHGLGKADPQPSKVDADIVKLHPLLGSPLLGNISHSRLGKSVQPPGSGQMSSKGDH